MNNTRNLVIRDTIFEDCEFFAKYETDSDFTKYLSYEEERSYEDIVVEWVLSREDETKLQYTVIEKATQQPVGRVFIDNVNKHTDSLDLAKMYIVGDEKKQMELGRELLVELLHHCFIYLHMERVTLEHYTGDRIAAALYEELGFKNEGVLRNAAKKNGRYFDLHLMSLLRSEFFDKVHDK